MTNIINTQQYNFQPPPYVRVKGGIKRSRGGGSGCSTGRFDYQNFPRHYHYYFLYCFACSHTSKICVNKIKVQQHQATLESKLNACTLKYPAGNIAMSQVRHPAT